MGKIKMDKFYAMFESKWPGYTSTKEVNVQSRLVLRDVFFSTNLRIQWFSYHRLGELEIFLSKQRFAQVFEKYSAALQGIFKESAHKYLPKEVPIFWRKENTPKKRRIFSRWWVFPIFLECSPLKKGKIPILDSYFFNWVGFPPTSSLVSWIVSWEWDFELEEIEEWRFLEGMVGWF